MMQAKRRLAFLAAPLFVTLVAACSGDPGPAGPVGPPGEEGPSADPSISGITPNKAFLARTLDVTVSGFNTSWTDAVTLDFGPGVTVQKKVVASPTAIVATIEIAETAAMGPRDVIITEGTAAATYKGAFSLESPLEVELTGTQAQGSLLIGKAKQRDLSTPFDLTTTGDGFFEPLVYVNLALSGSAGINGQVDSAEMYSVNFVLFTDVNTAPGKGSIAVDSGSSGNELRSPAPESIDVAARTPTALMAGMPESGTVDAPFASLLYSFTPPKAGIYTLAPDADSPDATPNIAVLPMSGKFADLIAYTPTPTIVAKNTDPFYFVYWDASGSAGYGVNMTVNEVMTADVEPNNTCAQAQPAGALPASLMNLALEDNKDVDWIAFDVSAADVGKVVHVITEPGDEKTDTVVEVFGPDCTTSLGGPSSDSDFHEDFTSEAITTAGKHFVKVTNSTYGYSGTLYNLSIVLE